MKRRGLLGASVNGDVMSFGSLTTSKIKKDRQAQQKIVDRLNGKPSMTEEQRKEKEAKDNARIIKRLSSDGSKKTWTKRQHEEAVKEARIEALRDARFAISGALKSGDRRTHDAAVAAITKIIEEI